MLSYQLSKYATVEEGERHASCARAHLRISFHVFGNIFFVVSCFFCRNLTLLLFKKDVLVRIFLVKIWIENSICILILPKSSMFEYGCLEGQHIKEEKRQRE